MKNILILVAVAAFSIFSFHEWQQWSAPAPTPAPIVVATPKPTPVLPEKHLTPEGTFAILEYVSARTKTGVVGFEPGQMVKFVGADAAKGTLTVTDGTYNVDVKPEQLTNDLDMANLARRRDQASQQQLRNIIAVAQDEDAKGRLAANLEAAKSIGRRPSGALIGTSSTLNQGSTAASSFDAAYNEALRHRYQYGSPYYYLNR